MQPVTIPKIISVDDHVLEPPHLFERWLPSKYRDRGPRVIRSTEPIVGSANSNGMAVKLARPDAPIDWWHFEQLRMPLMRPFATAGVDPAAVVNEGICYDDVRPSCHDPSERLKDMDLNGVEASLCFPNTIPRFCGQTFLEATDKDLALACVRAYNDWMVQEWAGDSGGRLIPLTLVPIWDPQLAADEVRRNAARGVRAVTFSENPAALGLPSIHSANREWDPFLEACDETATVICIHIGSSSRMPVTSADAPPAVTSVLLNLNAMASMTDWLFSGAFARFPNLTLSYSEGAIGWIPFILERAERLWTRQQWLYDRVAISRSPREYFADHIYGCYISDDHGLHSLDEIGEDNVTFETDFPHTDGTWPNSPQIAQRELAHLLPIQVEKIVRGNAQRMLSLGP